MNQNDNATSRPTPMNTTKSLKTLMAVFSAVYIAALLPCVLASPIMLDINSTRFAQIGNHSVVINGTDDTGPNSESYLYQLVGTGNPHQNYIITQQADTTITCSPGATTSFGKSTTTTWGIAVGGGSIGADVGELGAFNPFSFSISESVSYSTTQGFGCPPSAQTACILIYQAVTAYTVDVTLVTTTPTGETTNEDLGQAIIYAPNASGAGSTAAVGIINEAAGVRQCLGDVDRVVTYFCGPAGGPDYWSGGAMNPGPWQATFQANMNPPASQCSQVIEASHFVN